MVDESATMAESPGAGRSLAAESPRGFGPALVLAFVQGDDRTPVRASPAPRGNLLGRGCTLFPGGALEDRRMSRSHADIRLRKQGWTVEDLGSRNGTRLRGALIEPDEPTALRDGDVLRMGGCVFVFREEAGDLPEGGRSDAVLVGRSDAMTPVRRAVAAIARDDAPVLITGETGTGKEVVSRALHEAGGRSGEFVAVRCGSHDQADLDAEIFGREAGGSIIERFGLLRAAQGGTILLDAVGEMSAGLQLKLLRVLETRRLGRPGEQREDPVDVRVVAATGVDLVVAVRDGRFRADLYARLCHRSIRLPPLRERVEDIPLLARALLDRHGHHDHVLHARLAEALMLQPWPLNVSGLDAVLGIAVESNPGPLLRMTEAVRSMLDAETP